MVEYSYLTDFLIEDESKFSNWLTSLVECYGHKILSVNYIFCNEDYLLELNQNHLDHNTHTDIITFDYSEDVNLFVDIFISVDRLKINAKTFNVDLLHELLRLMSHGLLHCMGFDDKTEDSKGLMRLEEDKCIHLYLKDYS